MDSKVKIQHLQECDYSKECSREKILAAVDESARQKKEKEAERARRDKEESEKDRRPRRYV